MIRTLTAYERQLILRGLEVLRVAHAQEPGERGAIDELVYDIKRAGAISFGLPNDEEDQ